MPRSNVPDPSVTGLDRPGRERGCGQEIEARMARRVWQQLLNCRGHTGKHHGPSGRLLCDCDVLVGPPDSDEGGAVLH